jgi:primosomal protein N' (replication factor Y)
MSYYLVHVAEGRYQQATPLTYSYSLPLKTGMIVCVPYGKKTVAGIVIASTSMPAFKTKAILSILHDTPLPDHVLSLLNWMQTFYPGPAGALVQLFIPSHLEIKRRTSKAVTASVKKVTPPKLTKEQNNVITKILESKEKTFLLYGETGSGKTRVYIELALKILARQKSALILTPEISLVPQLAASFSEVVGEDMVVQLHSGLTQATRTKNWLKILTANKPLVVIGTRSALFGPHSNLGLVVVDEMHEPAYKQESQPRYYALRAAARLAQLHGAQIVYGSATPSVNEYYLAERTEVPILRMAKTAKTSNQVARTVIDLRERSHFSRHPVLSDILLQAIEKRLSNGEQTLLFLNRRGTARSVLCKQCGWQALCPHCDMPLTYHGDAHRLRCHTCGFQDDPPLACQDCRSHDIVYRSLGTKALASSLQQLFAQARIGRFDTDNLIADSLQKQYRFVQDGDIDILVGTQLLGKGLDLPQLSLVGIVNADTALSLPDFSAAERSYQLLHQAIGRVGRGHRDGEVIVQTFHPDNPLLSAAVQQDWYSLYTHELSQRQKFLFPPYCFLLKISVARSTSASAEAHIKNLRSEIANKHLRIQMAAATPSFYEKTHGKYNWQLIIKAKDRRQLTTLVQSLPKGDHTYDLDPINLL